MEYKSLETKSGRIDYRIRKSQKAQRVSIVVRSKGSVEVVVPQGVPNYLAEKFLSVKSGWIIKKILAIEEKGEGLLEKEIPGDYKKYKDLARDIVEKKVNYYNNFYGFKIGQIFIRDQKTRWGSCSSRGNLNFSYKIIYLPEKLADYLVVHELCHLGQMNHSRRFWELVAKTIPQCRLLDRELKRISEN